MGFLSRIRRLVSDHPARTGSLDIYAPISGEIVKLETVPDPVFSEKIVGDGVAIKPAGEQILAPIDGTIAKIFEHNHAFSIESDQGVEIFVHFGIGTVELHGQGFKRLAEEGQKVLAGQAILAFDLNYLTAHADSVLTPVLVANMEDVTALTLNQGNVVAGKDIIYSVIF